MRELIGTSVVMLMLLSLVIWMIYVSYKDGALPKEFRWIASLIRSLVKAVYLAAIQCFR